MVVVQHLVCLTVVERQSVWLQTEPVVVAVMGIDCLYAVYGQHQSCWVQVEEVEGRWFSAEVYDTFVSRQYPQVASSVSHHIIAECQNRIVLHLCLVVEVHPCETLNTTAPYGMAHGILYQLVERSEVASSVVHPVNARIVLVLGMVQSDDTILPGAYPQAPTTVHQQRSDSITVTQTGIAHHIAAFLVQTEQASLPGTYIKIALGILGKRDGPLSHVDTGEIVLFCIITGYAIVRAYPYHTVAGGIKGIYQPGLFAPQVIGLELAVPTVIAHQSVASTNPESVSLICRHRTHIVVGQDTWRIGITAVNPETIAVESPDALICTHPHQSVGIEDQAARLLRSLHRCLRHDPEWHPLCRSHHSQGQTDF